MFAARHLLRQAIARPVSLLHPSINKQNANFFKNNHTAIFSRNCGSATFTSTSPLVKVGYEKTVGCWLIGAAGMVFSMICIGGYTRLTGSGLSMVDWKFQGGALPSGDLAWQEEFERYQQYPEYKRMHGRLMDLDDFKRIYFIEWFHRMWGRGIGFAVAIPGLYLAARGALKAPLIARITGLFALGASQGFIGWWMVKSGLEEPPSPHAPAKVSPYRLTTHLAMALGLYGGVLWTGLNVLRPYSEVMHATPVLINNAKFLKRAAMPGLIVSLITVLSGGFVAGNGAGWAYNTWPKMIDDWIPPKYTSVIPICVTIMSICLNLPPLCSLITECWHILPCLPPGACTSRAVLLSSRQVVEGPRCLLG